MDGRQGTSRRGDYEKIIGILLLKALRCILGAFFYCQ